MTSARLSGGESRESPGESKSIAGGALFGSLDAITLAAVGPRPAVSASYKRHLSIGRSTTTGTREGAGKGILTKSGAFTQIPSQGLALHIKHKARTSGGDIE